MIDHVGFSVADFKRAMDFYNAAFAPLGVSVQMGGKAEDGYAGFGTPELPFFWIGSEGKAGSHNHVAFVAETHAQVDAFYAAAIAAGGRDNGPPGPRPHYHPNYYAAFVWDLDGNNIEAVCHKA